MKKLGGLFLCLLAILIFPGFSVIAQTDSGSGRDPQFEQEIADRLGQISPQAVPVFKAATASADAGDYDAARSGFQQVLVLAPGFPDALRRLSQAEVALDDYQNAEIHARQAVAAIPSLDNKAALAYALAGFDDKTKLSESLVLAQEAVKAEPDELYYLQILMIAAAENENIESLRQATNRLIELEPEYAPAHYFAGLVAAQDGKWEQAESELLLAEKFGLPKDTIDEALDKSGVRSQVMLTRALRGGGIGLAGWLAGLALLFLAGLVLSWITLRAVKRQISSRNYEVSRGERFIRQVYRVVIGITSVYFYLSMPVLIVLVIAFVGGIIYLFFAIGRIPLQITGILLITGIYTLIAIVRSVFSRAKFQDPQRKVTPEEMPELWQMANEVAKKVGTRPVDSIFLTPGVEVAVTERGSLADKLRDRGQRILILGMGSLPALTQGQLRAILAHEYGHFTNRDTAGGAFARQVQFSVHMMAQRLIYSGMARWYNPAWWFVNGYYRVFLRITLGASRLQEILADRIAVLSYGIQDMVEGLTHLIRKDVEFGFQLNEEVERAKNEKDGLHNLYALPPVEDPAAFEQRLAELMGRPSSAYDSHPAPRDRIALIQQIKVSGFVDYDPRPAWNLIPHADGLQEEFTANIEKQLRQQDILTA